jgi:phosphatidylserine/phosphatidylglycerophosphate/cardiolipin synthase-like enzyme
VQFFTSDYGFQILSLIRNSTSSIDVLCYVSKFVMDKRSDGAFLIFDALRSFHSLALPVRFILDYPRVHKANYHCNQFSKRRFVESGFLVRYVHSGETQHAKLVIFDHKIAVFGSHNLTPHSVRNRFDISLCLDDPALVLFLVKYYDHLWSKSVEAW